MTYYYWSDPVQTNQEYIEVKQEIVHRDAVSVEIEALIDEQVYTGIGVARKHPQDKFNLEVGLKLSYARALEAIADKLRKQADGRVKHLEDMQKDKLRRKDLKLKAELQAKEQELKAERLLKENSKNAPDYSSGWITDMFKTTVPTVSKPVRPFFRASEAWGTWNR